MVEESSCALVLLAAGSSRRMGRPKQLLSISGQPLLRHVVEAVTGPALTSIIVVLGANALEIRSSLQGLPVRIIDNEGWAEGMGSSIRLGIQSLLSSDPKLKGVIVALGDQPEFSSLHISRLIDAHRQTGRSIVASRCRGKRMPPAFFAAMHFPELMALQGDTGARALFQIHDADVADVSSDDLRDLDTPEDYADYLQSRHNGRISSEAGKT